MSNISIIELNPGPSEADRMIGLPAPLIFVPWYEGKIILLEEM